MDIDVHDVPIAVVDAVAVLVGVAAVVVGVEGYSAATVRVLAVVAVVLHPHQRTFDISARLGQKCRI